MPGRTRNGYHRASEADHLAREELRTFQCALTTLGVSFALILAGIVVVVPVYWLFDQAYDIGNDPEYPAPAAHAWRGVAEVLSNGFDSLPPHAPVAILCGLLFGAAMPIIRKLSPKAAPWTPSALAIGIAFIVPPAYPIAMFAGSMALVLWRKLKPKQCAALVFAVASGLIAGEGGSGRDGAGNSRTRRNRGRGSSARAPAPPPSPLRGFLHPSSGG